MRIVKLSIITGLMLGGIKIIEIRIMRVTGKEPRAPNLIDKWRLSNIQYV